MIQAIVFLPLLGAIIAGLISIFGAMRAIRPATRSSITTMVMAPTPIMRASHAHDDHGHDDHGHDDHHVSSRRRRVRARPS